MAADMRSVSSFGARLALIAASLALFPLSCVAQSNTPADPPASPPSNSEKSDEKKPEATLGTTPVSQSRSALEAMNASIARQKRSVQRQTRSAIPQGNAKTRVDSWFSAPWPADPIPTPSGQPALALPASSVSFRPADFQADCDPLPREQITPMIRNAAIREGVREDLVLAVIERESAFRPCAISPKGAQGLMQLMPATARELGVIDPFDPQQSLDGGVRLLKQLLDRYKGNYELALSAYNAGAGRVDREGGVPDIAETKDYVIQILSKLVF